MNSDSQEAQLAPSHFIRAIIEQDQKNNKWQKRVTTRFPPEPNGHLHIGHVKSICLNFGLANEYKGVCHLRLDDTNPEKESVEYVNAIIEAIHWLGFTWEKNGISHLHYASDYFEKLYQYAELLIERGHAYVDSQDAEQIRKNRGNLTESGIESPFRNREIIVNLELFRKMRAGQFQDGEHVLRLKIDMASPNINLRDPIIYRIRHVEHHRTKNAWCIYPMYDYTHCISDAIENITHSLCTLEFEDHRPLYEWILERLAQAGVFTQPLPQQIEFARLKLSYAITSKRKILELIQKQNVNGWDDPRLTTLLGLRRRGYTNTALRLFCERIGVSKADSLIELSVLEQAVRDDLDPTVPRAVAVLNPLKVIIDNFGENKNVVCHAPIHPHYPERGHRHFEFSKELWIEQEDFNETPPKGFFRLSPGKQVRLRHGFVVECTHVEKDDNEKIMAVHCQYFPDSQSGTPGANNYKVKGNIHWLSADNCFAAEVRLFERLFTTAQPENVNDDLKTILNPLSKKTIQAFIEPSAVQALPGDRLQFERHGYFVADRVDSRPNNPIFNRIVSLKDNWVKIKPNNTNHSNNS